MPAEAPDSERMPDMADLIQRRRDAGDSYRDIARRTGEVVDFQTVERWHKRAMRQFPRDPEVFTGFARALDENVEQVVLSMAVQLKVPVRRYSEANMVPGLERLSPDQRHAFRLLVRLVAEDRADPHTQHIVGTGSGKTTNLLLMARDVVDTARPGDTLHIEISPHSLHAAGVTDEQLREVIETAMAEAAHLPEDGEPRRPRRPPGQARSVETP